MPEVSDKLAGKVALVTGAARGQGRSHAEHLAAAGADVILVDVGRQFDTVTYPMPTEADLAETVSRVEGWMWPSPTPGSPVMEAWAR